MASYIATLELSGKDYDIIAIRNHFSKSMGLTGEIIENPKLKNFALQLELKNFEQADTLLSHILTEKKLATGKIKYINGLSKGTQRVDLSLKDVYVVSYNEIVRFDKTNLIVDISITAKSVARGGVTLEHYWPEV
jgi:hypothetical protein